MPTLISGSPSAENTNIDRNVYGEAQYGEVRDVSTATTGDYIKISTSSVATAATQPVAAAPLNATAASTDAATAAGNASSRSE